MSKRLTRISAGKLYPSLDRLVTHKINAVLSNGNTVFGKLISFGPDQITLEDTRGHSHQLIVSELYEIVYDDQEVTLKSVPIHE
ncbi:hypothetical protein [Dyadobacter sp. MSC1_007]|jgi:hypothetical protein|uniref:hypothetical protein n=1 Tax=Dyadobacter sp. MSC1_007 TaxID=2909264 RepID=UPI00202F5E59|nr:hypothetical protein [Dyadobacter sp. MSC1_007]